MQEQFTHHTIEYAHRFDHVRFYRQYDNGQRDSYALDCPRYVAERKVFEVTCTIMMDVGKNRQRQGNGKQFIDYVASFLQKLSDRTGIQVHWKESTYNAYAKKMMLDKNFTTTDMTHFQRILTQREDRGSPTPQENDAMKAILDKAEWAKKKIEYSGRSENDNRK